MKKLITYITLCGLFPLTAVLSGCDKHPVTASEPPAVEYSVKKNFESYAEKDGYLPPNYKGVNASDMAKAVNKNFLDILSPKKTTETSAEFAKRASLENFNPEMVDLDALYAVLLDNESWSSVIRHSNPSLKTDYDADNELMHFRVLTKNMFNLSVCEDLARKWDMDSSVLAKLKKISSQEHPINCYLADGVTLSISNKNPVFKKNIVRVKGSSYLDTQYQLDLVDSFKYPLKKARQLVNFEAGVLFVGKIDKDIKIGDFVWFSNDARGIPFNLKHIVYFHKPSGEILLKRDY
jgi:hypothetical protein